MTPRALPRTSLNAPLACLAALCITGAVAIDGDTLRLDAPRKDLRLRVYCLDHALAGIPLKPTVDD